MEDRYVGTLSKHEIVVDLDYFEELEATAQAWDMLTRSITFESPEDDTEFAYELRGKMELLLKIAQEKEEDM